MLPALTTLVNVLDAVPQPVWLVDAQGRVLYANRAAAWALGCSDACELLGRPSSDTLSKRPNGSAVLEPEYQGTRATGAGEQAYGHDGWLTRKDGSFLPVSWRSTPVRLPGGWGAVYVFRDAAERAEAERGPGQPATAEIPAHESRAAHRRSLEKAAAQHRQVTHALREGVWERLACVLLGLQLAQESLNTGSSEVTSLIAHAIGDARAALDQLRELVSGTHPTALTVRGLPTALAALAAQCPVPTVYSGNLDHRLPIAVESTVYSFMAEALVRAAEHGATKAEISATLGPDLEVSVWDDGVATDDSTADWTGLAAWADHFSAFDGTLTIDSSASSGTTVLAVIPMTSSAFREDNGLLL
jgi:PAS domain S-box-containing protein